MEKSRFRTKKVEAKKGELEKAKGERIGKRRVNSQQTVKSSFPCTINSTTQL